MTLVKKIIELLKLNPEMPAVYVVDQALRNYIDALEKEIKE